MPRSYFIPKPCAEPWSNMTPEGAGRHCAQCAKVVIDLTQIPATDIQDRLDAAYDAANDQTTNNSGVCVRTAVQPLRQNGKLRRRVLHTGLASMLALGASCTVEDAQSPEQASHNGAASTSTSTAETNGAAQNKADASAYRGQILQGEMIPQPEPDPEPNSMLIMGDIMLEAPIMIPAPAIKPSTNSQQDTIATEHNG